MTRQPSPRSPISTGITAALIAIAFVVSTGARAQTEAIDPYLYSCGDLLAAAGAEPGSPQNTLGNMMVLWSVGYMYGRLSSIDGTTVTGENFDLVRDDMVGALTSICPNVPDMPIAEFASNLANDFERALSGN